MKNVATPKQTGGAGFAFENKVVAYYLLWMLTGSPPFSLSHGSITRINCQVRVDGWLLDDLLLTFSSKNKEYQYAFSIRSNPQFTSKSAPSDFVENIWSQYLNEISKVFDQENDHMGIICVPHPNPPKIAIQSLLRKAQTQTPEQLSSRIDVKNYASEVERDLFKSFACPSELAKKYNIDRNSIGKLLKKTSVIELDFENSDSFDEAKAIFLCSLMVQDCALNTGKKLWQALCQVAQQIRTTGGGKTRKELLSDLHSSFELRDLSDFADDWKRLRAWCNNELENIPDLIAGAVQIERDDLVDEVNCAIREASFIALLGASGTGKIVIAKKVAQEFSHAGNVLWFKGGRLRMGYMEKFADHHNLTHPISEVLSHSKHTTGLIIIDSAERLLNEDDFKEAAFVLNLLGMKQAGCIWHVLVTCQAEYWERAQIGMQRHFGQLMDWKLIRLSHPNVEELQPVWDSFQPLHDLAVRPHLENFLTNFKILDLFAIAIQSGHNLEERTWIGESYLIRWYWQNIVRGGTEGAARAVLLQTIAEREAEEGIFEIPEREFSPSELQLVNGLRELLAVDEEQGTITFVHDLIAEWARFHLIRSHENELEFYLKPRLSNPHWHSSIRIYGISLLEADTTAEKWKEVFDKLPDAQNLFLESLIFAGNSQFLLERVWPLLVAKKGRSLWALLKRFQFVATIPNPEYISLAHKMDMTDIEAGTWERLPLWMYWLGVLHCLGEHIEDVVNLAPIEGARLTRTWLRYTPSWPGREQAANLALAIGWQTLRNRYCCNIYGSDGQLPYRATLEAYKDKPDEVREFVLHASARKVPTEDMGKAFDIYQQPGTRVKTLSSVFREEYITPNPWPDGPLYKIDDTFRAVCLETDALRSIMEDTPELATEIILSLLIAVRIPETTRGYRVPLSLPGERIGFTGDMQYFSPRFYNKGPFLLFLGVNPIEALKTIIRVVDFATEKWMETGHEIEARNGIIGGLL